MNDKKETLQEKKRDDKIAPVQKEIPKPGIQVYIGPSFKGAARGTIYNNGPSTALVEAVKRKSVIGELLVPIEKLAAANRELASSDSALCRIYRSAEDFFRKGE